MGNEKRKQSYSHFINGNQFFSFSVVVQMMVCGRGTRAELVLFLQFLIDSMCHITGCNCPQLLFDIAVCVRTFISDISSDRRSWRNDFRFRHKTGRH